MTTATLYRDADYGALAIYPGASGLVTIDHGFLAEDFEAALSVLERHGRGETQPGPGACHWRLESAHPLQVMASVDAALRLRGYADDALGERAILRVTSQEAARPDFPAPGKWPSGADLDAHVRALITPALAEAAGAPVPQVAVAVMPRPNSQESAPWARARALLPAGDAKVVQERLRAALVGPVREILRRATVTACSPTLPHGRLLAEIALAIPRALLNEWESAILPAFRPATHGWRQVWLKRGEKDVPESLLSRAREGGAIVGEARQGPRALGLRIPSAMPGDHLADTAFSERLCWLTEALGVELVGIDPYQDWTPAAAHE